MRIDVVIYDGFDDLDALGPYELLRHAARWTADGDWDVALVGSRTAGRVTSAHGVRYEVEQVLGEGRPDGVVVPGGGWHAPGSGARAESEGGLPARLVELARRARWTASVCTGAMILARAGMLAGRPATTHPTAFDDLAAAGASVRPEERVVDDGDVLTAGGVISGLDLALRIIEREIGADAATGVAEHVRYVRPERSRPGDRRGDPAAQRQ